MLSEQEYKSKVQCPECGKEMYALKGSMNQIYICSHCGASIDQKTLDLIQNKDEKNQNREERSLLQNLFSKQFMKKYTDFINFREFIKECNLFDVSLEGLSEANIENIPERKINRYVRKHTCFSTWDQMFEKAVEWYLKM